MSTSESYSVPARLRAILKLCSQETDMPYAQLATIAGKVRNVIAELTTSSASGAPSAGVRQEGWRPLSELPDDGEVLTVDLFGGRKVTPVSGVRHLMKFAASEKDECYYKAFMPLPEPPHED